jgi:hypothetical protein
MATVAEEMRAGTTGEAAAEHAFFATSLEHLWAEAEWVGDKVRQRAQRMRRTAGPGDEFRGLVISEEELDDLLACRPGAPGQAEPLDGALAASREGIAARREESLRRGVRLRLVELESRFGLSEFDLMCLLLCFAGESDLRYERIFAYLQDDITKKHPSVNLLMSVACSSFEEQVRARGRLAAGAPLMRFGFVILTEEPSRLSSTLLSKSLRVDERIMEFLLESDALDPRVTSFAHLLPAKKSLDELILPTELKARLVGAAADRRSGQGPTFLYFKGSYGRGRKAAAEALCQSHGTELLHVDVETMLGSQGIGVEALLMPAVREVLLRDGSLYVAGFDLLLLEDKAAVRKRVLQALRDCPRLVFLAGEEGWEPREELEEQEFLAMEFPRPDFPARVELWRQELGRGNDSSELDAGDLANKFKFTGGQIRDAVRTWRRTERWKSLGGEQVNAADLYEACRLHSSMKLSALGRKIKPHHRWGDLVLPKDRSLQLREICNSMKYRSVVFDQWGFDRKLSLGKGLNMLFAGPSGTGKTMAAEIMAGELGLDVYKIDLSTIVSKYIGETEKNLARIFSEAETSNAILFFDEADALFGKRSEVRDSHDRYANVEINYLLQKMEEHEGVVILATNFRKNMDDAFVRRLHFAVEFPLPSEAERRVIWERIWPKETPQSPDLDFDFMARRFEMPGGNIRNVAMAAAFLAASDGDVVKMSHLLHGTRREYQKMGKVVTQSEFQ